MDPLENKFDVGYRRSVVLEDSKGFLGPDDLAGRDSPAETPRMTEPLSFRQVRFASPLGTPTDGKNARSILQNNRSQ
jgi:hypothetical protein